MTRPTPINPTPPPHKDNAGENSASKENTGKEITGVKSGPLNLLLFVGFLALSALTIIAPPTSPAWAVPHPAEKLTDAKLESRAVALTHNLRCVVCQNETIAESSADMARDMRLLVRREILAGKTDDEIIAFLRARYGDFILMTPPFAPRTYILWLAPVIILGAGVAMLYPTFKRQTRKPKNQKAKTP